jgi:ATP-dependent Clp protease ATP-binding subunit ClpC
VGASGVGKTELAKQLAEQFFGDNRKLIKINMNDFREPHTASRLVGAPPGYVGYNRGGELTEALRKNPFSVVLFDEVEKAHPEVVTNILLQLMDEGVLSDMSTGALVDGSNALIMMTSNLGNRETLQREMGFAAKTKESLNEKQYKERILSAVRSFFPPEFLGRLDEIVLFNRLTPDVRKRILEKAVRQLEDKLKKTLKASVTIKLSDRALSLLLEEASEDKEAGARAVLRVVKLRIEEPCAEMFGGQLEEGVAQSIRVDVDNFGKVVLTLETI